MNSRTRISAKGQVVIPKDLRERLRWYPGTPLEVIEREGAVTLQQVKRHNPFPPTTVEDLRRWPAYQGTPKSVEEISSLSNETLLKIFDEQERDASA